MDPFVRSFEAPDELIELEAIRSSIITHAGQTISYDVQQPGWRWSTHIRPLVGTEWCQVRHVGILVDGTMRFLFEDGTEIEAGPMSLIEIPAGHDAWVVGDEPATTIAWSGVRDWLAPLESLSERVLATIVFTDIDDSTGTALRLGDRAWGDLLATIESRSRDILARYRGREVKMTGDGLLAVFDGAARALRCAVALRNGATDLGISVRAAVHTGEIELAGSDIRGLAVHEASRILAVAGPGEVLASATTVSLAGEAGLAATDRGHHELRGLEGSRQLFAVG